jgi:hypothetical protein
VTPSCLDRDVYVRDNKLDTGEQIPSPSGVSDPTVPGATVYWWESPDIKVDAYPYFPVDALFDGVEFDAATAEDVVRNDATHANANRLYVQVHNRGPLDAHNVKVKVLWADASAGLPLLPADFWSRYPNDWTAASTWNTVDPLVPFQQVGTLAPNTPKVLRWDWTVPVSAATHTCMLVVVSADEDPVVRSDAVLADRQLWILVPGDKHVGLRNLHVITGSDPFGGRPLLAWLDLHNPFPYPRFFDLVADRRALQAGARLALVLPKVVTRPDLSRLEEAGIRVQRAGKGWWTSALATSKARGLTYSAEVSDISGDPCHRSARLPDLLLNPEQPLRVGVVVQPPAGAKPGETSQFSVFQVADGRIVGGSTFEVRIPPLVVEGRPASARARSGRS